MMYSKCSESSQRVRSILIIMTSFLFLYEWIYAQDEEAVVIGEKVRMQSHILEKEIQLSIHIPDGYESSNTKYPVLYSFQTHFEQIAGAVKDLYDYRLTPQMICVQIDNYTSAISRQLRLKTDQTRDRQIDFSRSSKKNYSLS